MSDDRTLRTILEFVTEGNREFVSDLIQADRGAQQVSKSLKGATTAAKGWNESLQARWTKEFRRELGELPAQIRANEQAIKRLNKAQLESNLAFLPKNGASSRVGSSFGNIVDQEDKAAQQASRSYANLSTAIDGAIAARRRESSQFAQSIRARMEENSVISQQIERVKQLNQARRATQDSQRAGSSRVAQNLSYIPENDTKNVARLGASFGDIEDSATGAANATGNFTSNLPRLRYALYDVSQSLTVLGAGLIGVTALSAGLAIKFQRDFANVERSIADIGESGVARLREEFDELFRTLPVGFATLAEIGKLGGQLSIPANQLAEFTSLVARFSATTDVTVDAAATAFGRLSQLLKVPASEFENLGASISRVGINAIATEPQIIAISTQISAIASSAGLSAAEVFGLSAALASVGTQPELARGTITRLFTQINVAIAQGGDRLNDFAKLTGQSAAAFQQAWGTDSRAVLEDLFAGLANVEASGGDAAAAIRELGITSVRDVPTLLKLAQNTDILSRSLNEAVLGYEEGTELQRQYGIVADTVAEKITLLGNNIQSLIATVGESGTALGGLLDLAIEFTQAVTRLIDNPAAMWFFGITGAAGAVAGVLALVAGLVLRGVASWAAYRTALIEAQVAAGMFKTQADAANVSTLQLARSTRAATVAFRSLVAATGVGIALLAIGAAFDFVGQQAASATEKADAFFGIGATSGFAAAVADDTKVFEETGQAVAKYALEVEQAAPALQTAEGATRTWLGIQGAVPSNVDAATEAVTGQTLALGDNAQAWIQKALSENEAIQKIANDPAALAQFEALGGNIQDFITAGLEGNAEGYAEALIAPLREAADNAPMEEYGALINQVQLFEDAFLSGGRAIDAVVRAQVEAGNTTAFLGGVTQDATGEMAEFGDVVSRIIGDIYGAVNAEAELAVSFERLGAVFFNTGSEAAVTSAEFQGVVGTLIEQAGSVGNAVGALEGFFNALIQGGFASAGQLAFLREAINQLKAEAGVLGQAIGPVAEIDLTPMRFGFNQAGQAAQKAAASVRDVGDAAAEAAKEVRTLVDYGNDLAGVFARAFDLRFGNQQALDAVTEAWNDLADSQQAAQDRIDSAQDAIDDARSSIIDYRNEIKKLRAEEKTLASDKAILKYFLSIAEAYGDELRAAQLRAEIGEIDAELAENKKDQTDASEDLNDAEQDLKDATEEYKDAVEDASKALNGNSQAAIKNRQALLGLIGTYADQIQAAADNGASQEELAKLTDDLRQDFIDQATQAGFSKKEIDKYAGAFDDMAFAVAKVPRNITVTASTNPAQQALNEFIAKAANAGRDAGRNFRDKFNQFSSGLEPPPIKFPPTTDLRKIVDGEVYRMLLRGFENGSISKANFYRSAFGYDPGAGFAEGGYTGRGGKYQPAGVVHKGEYVVPKSQVNQSTGMPYANALGQAQTGMRPSGGYASGGFVSGSQGSAMMVELSPYDRKLLMAAGNIQLKVGSKVLASTVNGSNYEASQRGIG